MERSETSIPFGAHIDAVRVIEAVLTGAFVITALELAEHLADPRLSFWISQALIPLLVAGLVVSFSVQKRLRKKLLIETIERRQAVKNFEIELQRSEERLRLAMEAGRMGFWHRNLLTEEQLWSEGAKKLLGLQPNSIANFEVLMNAIHPEDRSAMRKAIDDAVGNKSDLLIEYRTVWPDGSVHWLFARGRAFYDAKGKPTRITGIAMDIDDRKAQEERLRLQAAALQAAANAIVITDSHGRILWTNPAFSKLTGYSSEEALGRTPSFLKSGRHDNSFYADLWSTVLSGRVWHGELFNRRKNGSFYNEEQTITPVRSEAGQISNFVAIKRDITDRKRAEERIQHLAYFDAVTELPNRVLFQDRLTKAIAAADRRQEKLALVFLDLDHFKVINDSLGHSFGDLLLNEVATRLKQRVREQDTVARLGGDEFVVLLTEVKDIGDVAVAAKRAVDALSAGFFIQGRELNVTSSAGISIFPDHGTDSVALTKNADAAMYYAKEKGRANFQFFTPEMNAQVMERLNLETSLRGALERNELFLMYQPQVEISTGRIVGAEALVRWQHPELGLVPPNKFIGIAENSGLIMPIGEWVLRTACAQARRWQDQGLPAIPIAVNVSAVQFRQEGFLELVRKVLDETGLPPQLLELELTESLIMSNADVIVSVLRQLKATGVKLSIDDFGTGYSSLSYLSQFPVYKLKIDRSFMRDLAVEADNAAITSTIISMAKSLKLKVIAEGVENEEQMSFLRRHQCDEIQGYYFSQPLKSDDFGNCLHQRTLLSPSSLPSAGIEVQNDGFIADPGRNLAGWRDHNRVDGKTRRIN
jgi:diguanylate cyclase (GGDEF)-like protein/PAS domain S-box-containing protein